MAAITAEAGGIAFFERSVFRCRRTASTTTGAGSPVSPSERRTLSTDGIARKSDDFIAGSGGWRRGWESNPPLGTECRGDDFEDRDDHQARITLRLGSYATTTPGEPDSISPITAAR